MIKLKTSFLIINACFNGISYSTIITAESEKSPPIISLNNFSYESEINKLYEYLSNLVHQRKPGKEDRALENKIVKFRKRIKETQKLEAERIKKILEVDALHTKDSASKEVFDQLYNLLANYENSSSHNLTSS